MSNASYWIIRTLLFAIINWCLEESATAQKLAVIQFSQYFFELVSTKFAACFKLPSIINVKGLIYKDAAT